MARWLMKEEPEHYSYAQLERDGGTVWSGVRNPVAQKHLRAMRKGDEVLYYHTGKEKAVVAVARVARDAYADPQDASGKSYVVDVEPVRALPRPVTLASIKAESAFAQHPLVRIPRLSVMPMADVEWERLLAMSGK
jgi:predicted RNA-binding protein with PUA-like domain